MSERRKRYELKLIALLAILTFAFLCFTFIAQALGADEEDPTQDFSVLKPEGIARHLSYEGQYGSYSFNYEQAVWTCESTPDDSVAPADIKPDATELGIVTQTIKTFEPTRALTDVSDKLAAWNLTEDKADKLTIKVEGESYTYYIGTLNTVTGEYFVRSDHDSDRVFMIPQIRIEMADVPFEKLIMTEDAAAESEENAE